MNKYIHLFFFIFVALSQGKVLTNSHVVAMKQKPQYQSMRILFVIGRFPWYTKSIIVNQLVGLLDRGHDVHLFAKIKMNDYKLDSALDNYNFSQRVYYEKLPDDLHTYDVIIFQSGILAKEFCGIKKKYGLKAKLVTFLRGSDVTNKREALCRAYKKLFSCGDLFLPVCDYFRRCLLALGCDPKKIIVHYSGIDCSKFPLTEYPLQKNRIRIMSVGRLIEKKGLRYAIEAVTKLVRKYPFIEYVIVGGGYERANLTQLINNLGVSDNIRLVGWKTQNEIIQLLHQSDIFVLPSVTAPNGSQEGIANALKEAMLIGVPVVSTYGAGTAELVANGKNGLLVPQKNVMVLVKAIQDLIIHPKKRDRLGRAGREKVLMMCDSITQNREFESLLLGLL